MKTWEYCILNSRPEGSSITYVKSDGRHIQEKIDSPFTAMAQLGDAGWDEARTHAGIVAERR